ncbi:MAG: HipA domain-containing protein [Marinilabiliaceae bacterium]|nr:HipA domain-containing protein [Marinilabiliaceae bacterium]
MSLPEITHCPGTLAPGHTTYSSTCLRRLFNGRLVSHILPYHSPATGITNEVSFAGNQQNMSISGVQEKFSVILEGNKLRLANEGEHGTYILKPIPSVAQKTDQMPANEHLTMQIARQIYNIETAENAMIFFEDGSPAYITKRFDVTQEGPKLAMEDLAALTGRTQQTHGANYKYQGNYLEMFEALKKHLPAYRVEAVKLFKIILLNYLFSNGDAHFKNFSILETPMGDYRFSPAYDLVNSRIHVEDQTFALSEGLLTASLALGNVVQQFRTLTEKAEIPAKIVDKEFERFLRHSDKVKILTEASFLNNKTKRSYLQAYQTRLGKLKRSM